MIPKILHYCWFGGNPLPKLAKKCLKSWKKYCSDYEIIEWNEKNFDISSAPLYVKQAYEAKKWAFVSDYVRLYALIHYGGIYLDTDVQILKPLNMFLHHKAFSGFENKKYISTAILACQKNFPLFKQFLDCYYNISFYTDNGEMDLTPNVVRITNICTKKGFVPDNQYQILDGFAIYPDDFFCPKNYITGEIKKTKNTYLIHHFDGSWHGAKQKKYMQDRVKMYKRMKFKENIHNFLAGIYHIFKKQKR